MRKLIFSLAAVSLVLFAEKALCRGTTLAIEPLSLNSHEYQDFRVKELELRRIRTGRFLSVDPVIPMKKALRQPQWWNRYAYVANNPVNTIDPDGRCGEPCLDQVASREETALAEDTMTTEQYLANHRARGAGGVIGATVVGVIAGGPPAWSAIAGFARQNLAALGGGGSALLGETMRRVRSVANALNARTFETTSRNFSQMMSQNMQWLQRQMASGTKIYDIGINVARQDAGSAFYKAEMQALQNAGYSRQFVKLIEIDGKTYRVFQWVAPAK